MLTRETAIKRVTNFAKEIKANGLNLKKVILFGSYAKNQQHQWSDIDVVLVADEFIGFGFEDMKHFVNINIKNNYYIIQTNTYPTDYFDKGDPFINEIKRTGIEIKF
ncbi:MAG: nucleotidyltransferase domain-containing protein [Bacteroidetes bacterium]|nr:nucleotidyltransferase domain-containing protein [Bacteroidota bacterium]